MKCVGMLSIIFLCAALFAQDGFLDTTFNSTGYVETTGCAGSNVVTAVQSDGKIVIAGLNSADERVVIRYNENGTLDSSFGTSGIVTTTSTYSVPWDYGYGRAQDIMLQPDGKIIVVGSVKNFANRDRISVNRYNTDGSLDATFNPSGTPAGTIMTGINSVNEYSSYDHAFSCALTDDGKIVVGAYTEDGFNSAYSFAVIRYDSDGSLDTTLNSVGYVTTNLGWSTTGLYNGFRAAPRCGVEVQPDNKIIYVGTRRNATTDDMIIIRFHENGTLDSGFPYSWWDFYGDEDNASSVALQGNGKIIVGGTTYTGAPNYFLKGTVVRFNSNGTLDTTFGIGGKVELDFGVPLVTNSEKREIYRVKIQNNGKILVGGRISTNYTNYDIGVTRLLYDGTLDNTFGTNGSFSFTAYDKPKGFGMAIAPNGKIVISSGKSNNNFFTARLGIEAPQGAGTSANPYQISSLKDLYWLSINQSAWGASYLPYYFEQVDDIDASETTNWNLGQGWTPIGTSTKAFYGQYDGNEHSINNLYINNQKDINLGLFGYIYTGSVKNLKLINIDYTTWNLAQVGGIIGVYNSENQMENCSTTGSINNGYSVGGLAGQAWNIKNCFSSVIVNSDQIAGGLCGASSSPAGVITDSYSSGNVNGVEVGGLLGYNRGSVINCYSTGNVNGSYIAGGLIGSDDGGSVSNSFWDIETSGTTNGYGSIEPDPAGITGKTTVEMKMQSTIPMPVGILPIFGNCMKIIMTVILIFNGNLALPFHRIHLIMCKFL